MRFSLEALMSSQKLRMTPADVRLQANRAARCPATEVSRGYSAHPRFDSSHERRDRVFTFTLHTQANTDKSSQTLTDARLTERYEPA